MTNDVLRRRLEALTPEELSGNPIDAFVKIAADEPFMQEPGVAEYLGACSAYAEQPVCATCGADIGRCVHAADPRSHWAIPER